MQMSKNNLIQSVDRALQILEAFSQDNRELGVTEIAKSLGLHKSTTFGLLSTLENRGYVEQNQENGKYCLGLKLFELGNLVKSGMDLRRLAYPYIKDLVDQYRETVHLVVFDKGDVVYIDKTEGDRAIRILSQVGNRLPMYCTGVGKCMMAFLPEEYLQKYILNNELKAYTEFTITDKKKLMEQLEVIRQQGYAFDKEEIEIGLRCIAAPIKNYKNEIVAAISLSGPSMRMDEETMKALVEPVKQTALNISRNLGYQDKLNNNALA